MTTSKTIHVTLATLKLPKPVPALIMCANSIVHAMTDSPAFSTPSSLDNTVLWLRRRGCPTGLPAPPRVLDEAQHVRLVASRERRRLDGLRAHGGDACGCLVLPRRAAAVPGGRGQEPGGPTTLAADQENRFSIAADGVNVYWNGFDTLSSCPVSGCPGGPKIVASVGSAGAAGPVVTDGVSFYFVDYPSMGNPDGSILACPVSGCVVPATVSPLQNTYGLALVVTI